MEFKTAQLTPIEALKIQRGLGLITASEKPPTQDNAKCNLPSYVLSSWIIDFSDHVEKYMELMSKKSKKIEEKYKKDGKWITEESEEKYKAEAEKFEKMKFELKVPKEQLKAEEEFEDFKVPTPVFIFLKDYIKR